MLIKIKSINNKIGELIKFKIDRNLLFELFLVCPGQDVLI